MPMKLTMTLVPLLGGLIIVLASACSTDVKPGKTDAGDGACVSVPTDICRELTPGTFRLDKVDSCAAKVENEVPMSFCRPCQDSQASIKQEIIAIAIDAGKCVANEDCALIDVTPSCEFGCGVVYNVNFDVTRFNELASQWNSCTMCKQTSCARSFVPVPTFCDKGRCAVVKANARR